MRVLGIDTSTRVASCAVADVRAFRVLASIDREVAVHSDDLLVIINEVLGAAGMTAADLDAIAVGTGPGSFTGLRIGMATAKGLAFACGVPMWTASSLAALAEDTRAMAPAAKVIVALMDARRGEVFAGIYRSTDGGLTAVGDERTMAPGDLAQTIAEPPSEVAVVGEGAKRYPEAASAAGFSPRGARLGASGAAIIRVACAGERTDSVMTATPTYIRPADAERKFPDGNPGGTFAPGTRSRDTK